MRDDRKISEDENLQKNMTDLAELIMSKGSSPLADRRLRQQEVDLLYQVGENVFGLARKEAVQLIAEALQKDFVPNLLNDD